MKLILAILLCISIVVFSITLFMNSSFKTVTYKKANPKVIDAYKKLEEERSKGKSIFFTPVPDDVCFAKEIFGKRLFERCISYTDL